MRVCDGEVCGEGGCYGIQGGFKTKIVWDKRETFVVIKGRLGGLKVS